MLQNGFYVNKAHLAEQDLRAQEDLKDADARFRSWLRKYAHVIGRGNADHGWSAEEVPDLVNLSSVAQIQTLLFGGFQSTRDVLKTPTKAEAEQGMIPHNIKPLLATVCSLAFVHIITHRVLHDSVCADSVKVWCSLASSLLKTQSTVSREKRSN
jgi:hypothetical protein